MSCDGLKLQIDFVAIWSNRLTADFEQSAALDSVQGWTIKAFSGQFASASRKLYRADEGVRPDKERL